jgi:hypothetical protein
MISFLPSHLDAATSHFGRRHLAFTCRPPTVIVVAQPHRPHADEDHDPTTAATTQASRDHLASPRRRGAPATTLNASANVASTRALEPGAARAIES